MKPIKTILKENGWVRSIIALALVATWIATVFLRIPMDDQGKTFIAMVIAYYLAKPGAPPTS